MQLLVFNLQRQVRAVESNNSPTLPTEATLRPNVLGSHFKCTIDKQSGQDLRDHVTSKSPDRHIQHQILSHLLWIYPPSGVSQKTPRGDDAFGGSQQSVRTKCPLKPPKLSPSLLDMTRLTAVQDAWIVPTLDKMSPNAMCERY